MRYESCREGPGLQTPLSGIAYRIWQGREDTVRDGQNGPISVVSYVDVFLGLLKLVAFHVNNINIYIYFLFVEILYNGVFV